MWIIIATLTSYTKGYGQEDPSMLWNVRLQARAPFQKDDRARFVVFTTANKNNAWKTAIPSAPFVIQDQVIRGNGSFRVSH